MIQFGAYFSQGLNPPTSFAFQVWFWGEKPGLQLGLWEWHSSPALKFFTILYLLPLGNLKHFHFSLIFVTPEAMQIPSIRSQRFSQAQSSAYAALVSADDGQLGVPALGRKRWETSHYATREFHIDTPPPKKVSHFWSRRFRHLFPKHHLGLGLLC